MRRLTPILLMLFTLSAFYVTVPATLAQQATQGECDLTAKSDVSAYYVTDTTGEAFPISAGDESIVVGETSDKQWIGFDPGVAQAANIGLTRLRWVQNNASITLSGDCNNLPTVESLPTQGCVLTFGEDSKAYMQPDTHSTVVTTLTANDYAMVGGQLSSGWYAWSDPGAQAGSTGTIQLKWIQAADGVQVSGDCDKLPTFYPVPKSSGAICTLLTGANANAYEQPNALSASTALPGLEVQVLAQTSDTWFGYDPGDAENSAAGVARLRWIQAGDIDQMNGDCKSLPTVSTIPFRVGVGDDGASLTVHIGDSIEITQPSANDGATWMEDPASEPSNSSSIVQEQGTPQPGSSANTMILTFQAVGVGQTTLALEYATDDTAAMVTANQKFYVTVTVQK